ncbi:MAG: hypothetical protein HY917_02355 [Candidatus Diapherotrites archaeon]|nr:hypothetical protein [Candidatus Diapherotrites archaeon]
MTKKVVISDSSSLILITKARILEMICTEFELEIPLKVFEETVYAGKRLQKMDAIIIEREIEQKRIHVKEATRSGKNEKINELNLDAGEKEAILLFFQEKADLLLVDDRQAILAAKLLGIRWTTAPSLLVVLRKRQKIGKEAARAALKSLQQEGRYRMDLMLEALNELEKMEE